MEYSRLGKTGIKVSRVGLGTWQFSEFWGVTDYAAAKSIIEAAVEAGINLIDTAYLYGRGVSEEFVGRALRDIGVARGEVVIASKIPGELLGRDDVFKAVEISLRRLGVDSIDVMQVHWPPIWRHVPACEYARALERLVALGRIGYVGLSNHPPPMVEAFRSCLSRIDVEVMQYRFNLVEREAEQEIIPLAEKLGASLLTWSPLAKGAVLGKYSLEEVRSDEKLRSRDAVYHPENYAQILEIAGALKSLAERYGKTPSQVALNWIIGYSENTIPIPGAKSPEQARENAGAAGWRLSYGDWRLLDRISRKVRISYALG
ncbi:aldo/keto reductase [Aeropyrum camini]|uniref:Aldo/keto reductase n=1 Tax=Aeropyrum camini SY1 = JCM 12091 TaxID=1198449 RepID=U3TF15_9CREN|nr:aldo/keto reductase [Aeropyrum camini]BAN91056.1 aldo/keto reductase [Aeropyrum camini SY1 = JCM 12091]